MTLGSHQATVGKNQTHLTPRFLLEALGAFDLDPCAAPKPRPWPTARVMNSEVDGDGLAMPWFGRVFCNPPFDSRVVGRWVLKLAEHGNGILLIHARTETRWFAPIWEKADGILFYGKRVKFCTAEGQVQPNCSGAPLVLVAFGQKNLSTLRHCGLPGVLVTGWQRPRVEPQTSRARKIVAQSPSPASETL